MNMIDLEYLINQKDLQFGQADVNLIEISMKKKLAELFP